MNNLVCSYACSEQKYCIVFINFMITFDVFINGLENATG